MDIVPVRNIEWEVISESGLVRLKRPKFKAGVLKKHLLPLIRDPYFRIKLDDIGTFVWLKMDGHKNVAAYCGRFGADFW